SPLPGYGDGTGYELAFRIVEASPDDPYLHVYNDGAETKQFLPERCDRDDVTELLFYMVKRHIDDMKPDKIVMTTYAENLPETALRNYHRIAALFRHEGYEAGPADPWCGLWTWMMILP